MAATLNWDTGVWYDENGKAVSDPYANGVIQDTTSTTDTAGTKTKSGIDLSGSAADITTQLLRKQYENWKTQFQPIELEAINMLSYNNPDVLKNAVGIASYQAAESSNSMSGILERTNRALGIQQNEQQAAVSKRLMDLERAKSIAGSANSARAAVREQDEKILLGTASNPISSLSGS